MGSIYPPSLLSRASELGWVTSRIIDSDSSPSSSIRSGASSSRDLVPAPRPSDLQIILRTRDQTAYYDPSSNELSLQKRHPSRQYDAFEGSEPGSREAPLVPHQSQSLLKRFTRSLTPATAARGRNKAGEGVQVVCPTCARPWSIPHDDEEEEEGGFGHRFEEEAQDATAGYEEDSPSFMAPNYFRLLAQANTTPHSNSPSRPSTPQQRFSSVSGTSTPLSPAPHSTSDPIPSTSSAQGYYSRFFIELHPLGRGARGQVFLCQHILNNNKLGKYAIKKIPVGDHASSLLQSLNEVHLMESLHHPHLIHYQHAWIERCSLGKFQPQVPTLFVLMMAANAGSLADWISARAGEKRDSSPRPTGVETLVEKSGEEKVEKEASPVDRRKIERLKAALRQRRATRQTQPTSSSPPCSSTESEASAGVGVHLLRTEEIYSLIHDIVSGLSFLHNRGILHLDIKPGNVLLHWDEDSLIPRALLSDFGSSLHLHDNWTRTRSGHTGTMEYMSPETIVSDPKTGKLRELSSKADIWSVGMILHLLLFFKLPYGEVADVERLRGEIGRYKGFRRASGAGDKGGRGDQVLLGLLERMLDVDPSRRPSCEEILGVLHQAKQGRGEGRGKGGRTNFRAQAYGDKQGGGEGVSLALYRPAALPPLPRDRHTSPIGIAPETLIRGLVTKERKAIAVALVRCLSPTLISFSTAVKGGERKGPVETIANTLIILLALIHLSSSVSPQKRGRASVGCWIAHFTLLSLIWWTSY